MIAGGGPGNGHAHYHPWFSALAERHRVVDFDYLGTGRSDRPADPAGYSIERYAEHIEAVRAHLGAETLSLIGISFGGMPALGYALREPGRVRALVLSNAQLSAATWQEGAIDGVNAALGAQFPERWDAILAMRARGVRSLDDAYQELYGELPEDLEWADPRRGRGSSATSTTRRTRTCTRRSSATTPSGASPGRWRASIRCRGWAASTCRRSS